MTRDWRCLFGHDDERLLGHIPVRYSALDGAAHSRYGVRCRRCHRLALVEPRGAYSFSWYSEEEKTYAEAMALLEEQARQFSPSVGAPHGGTE